MAIFWILDLILGITILSTGVTGVTSVLMCRKPGELPRFHDTSEICCGGNLHPSLNEDNLEMACCQRGNDTSTAKLYVKDVDLCCNGHVYENKQQHMKNGHHLQCCGDLEVYYQNEKICCGNQLHKAGTTQDMDCCHSQLYNMSERGCCWDRVNDKYEFTRVHGNDDRCCGTELYNRNNYDCKHGETLVKLPKCGGNLYDTQQLECCDGKEVPKREGIDVCKQQGVPEDIPATSSPGIPCGEGYINANSMTQQEFCCDGVPRTHAIGPIKKLLYCCGTELIDDTQECCGNQVLTHSQECCNNTIYNVKELHDNNQQCCQGQIINRTDYICCRKQSSRNESIKKRNYTDNGCCRHIKKEEERDIITTFNTILETCDYEMGIKSKEPKSERKNNLPRCPFCGKRKYPSVKESCGLRNQYRLNITNITSDETGIYVKTTIIRPRSLEGKEITIWMTNHSRCKCFKPGQIKILYTNRSLEARRKFKLKTHEMLLPSSGNMRNSRKVHCGVPKKIRRVRKGKRKIKSSKRGRSNRRRLWS